MSHNKTIIPGLPCPACGCGMFMRSTGRAVQCAECGLIRRVKRYDESDGRRVVVFASRKANAKTAQISARVRREIAAELDKCQNKNEIVNLALEKYFGLC